MIKIARYILAIITGAIIGSLVNGFLISISSSIIPPPSGANLQTVEGLKAAISLMEPKHFIMPFLAHALGTFVGAILAGIIAPKFKISFALVIGILFLAGGIYMVIILPSPLWFTLLDLIIAYIPFALVGGYIGKKIYAQ